jgi:hypothetical protein
MGRSATQLSKAGAALEDVSTEDDLMEWHDNWMSSDDYTSMCDSDANELEDLFQRNASSFTDELLDSGSVIVGAG